MKLKLFLFILILLLGGCSKKENTVEDNRPNVYELATQLGYKGSYSDWLSYISQKHGKVVEPRFKIVDNYIYWFNKGSTTKYPLVSLYMLAHPVGESNKNIDFGINNDEIVWCYKGENKRNHLLYFDQLVCKENEKIEYSYKYNSIYYKTNTDDDWIPLIDYIDDKLNFIDENIRQKQTITLTLGKEELLNGYVPFNECDTYEFTPKFSSKYLLEIPNQESNIEIYTMSKFPFYPILINNVKGSCEIYLTQGETYYFDLITNSYDKPNGKVVINAVGVEIDKNIDVSSFLNDGRETFIKIEPMKSDVYKVSLKVNDDFKFKANMIKLYNKYASPIIRDDITKVHVGNGENQNYLYFYLEKDTYYISFTPEEEINEVTLTIESLRETDQKFQLNEENEIIMENSGVVTGNAYLLQFSGRKLKISFNTDIIDAIGYRNIYSIDNNEVSCISYSTLETKRINVEWYTRSLSDGEYYFLFWLNNEVDGFFNIKFTNVE